MDWKSLFLVFLAVFMAELGDKTQLAILGFASSGRSAVVVFLGASLALMATTLLAVLLGDRLLVWLPLYLVRKGAALLFVALGVILFLK